MSFLANAGNITIIDDTVDPPVITFDTDEQIFHCTDFLEGSVETPQRRGRYTPSGGKDIENVNVDHFIDSINEAADIVLGSFKVVTSGGSQGLNNLGVFNAGGNYVHYLGGPHNLSTLDDINSMVVKYASYAFVASGGSLILNERVYLDPWSNLIGVTTTVTLLPITFYYKLFIGTLT